MENGGVGVSYIKECELALDEFLSSDSRASVLLLSSDQSSQAEIKEKISQYPLPASKTLISINLSDIDVDIEYYLDAMLAQLFHDEELRSIKSEKECVIYYDNYHALNMAVNLWLLHRLDEWFSVKIIILSDHDFLTTMKDIDVYFCPYVNERRQVKRLQKKLICQHVYQRVSVKQPVIVDDVMVSTKKKINYCPIKFVSIF